MDEKQQELTIMPVRSGLSCLASSFRSRPGFSLIAEDLARAPRRSGGAASGTIPRRLAGGGDGRNPNPQCRAPSPLFPSLALSSLASRSSSRLYPFAPLSRREEKTGFIYLFEKWEVGNGHRFTGFFFIVHSKMITEST
jgi:hypothetical protein